MWVLFIIFIGKPDFARTNHKLRACLIKRTAKRNQSCHSAASTRIPSPSRPQDPLRRAADSTSARAPAEQHAKR